MLATMPEMNEKISVAIHMGPVVFIKFFKAPFLGSYASVKQTRVRVPCRARCMGCGAHRASLHAAVPGSQHGQEIRVALTEQSGRSSCTGRAIERMHMGGGGYAHTLNANSSPLPSLPPRLARCACCLQLMEVARLGEFLWYRVVAPMM